MKKMIALFIIISTVIGTILYIYNNPNKDGKSNEMIVVNNSKGEFDYFFSNETMSFFSLEDAPVSPFQNLEILEQLTTVNKVYPYYHLTSSGEGEKFYYQKGNSTEELQFPLKGFYDSGEVYLIDQVQLKVVTNEDNFISSHRKYVGDLVIREFDCSSGIFISEHLYKILDLDEKQEQLLLTIPVRVPVVCEYIDSNFDQLFDFQEYYPIIEEIVEVKLEVQGVIAKDNSGVNFCTGNTIVIPYELSKDIMESVDQSKYKLKESQIYYQPNTCIIELHEGVEERDFAIEAYENQLNIVYELYDYGMNFNAFKFWFDGNELLTWPNV